MLYNRKHPDTWDGPWRPLDNTIPVSTYHPPIQIINWFNLYLRIIQHAGTHSWFSPHRDNQSTTSTHTSTGRI